MLFYGYKKKTLAQYENAVMLFFVFFIVQFFFKVFNRVFYSRNIFRPLAQFKAKTL